ncbi:MAG: 1-(5-phosphoribosyl)-5-amino-4-imidazole-carboxylate carboxylase, partial [Lachnospiraceae bacterium]|nr:1-(5-phosphoribosyl)-5-amino-4-imidazole-carboxylate carboxylase [Lachnospiraceae bacterium]
MDIRGMLEKVQSGEMDIPQAEELLKKLPYEDLGYAKLDHHRRLRSGFGEVVFCQGKPDEYLREIFRRFYEQDREVLGTRASKAQ